MMNSHSATYGNLAHHGIVDLRDNPIEVSIESAKGAEYESQGQVRSEASTSPLVTRVKERPALKGRKYGGFNVGPSGLALDFM